ncbi:MULTISPECIES: zinc ribbon domain-containing protein [Clostridium]|jgi:hypothetical protein|uniref:zinc ribbon domain-containing protein n=1 Tax=Clostridium TaxID=1485 RepID=UPI00028972B7|nr:MULTISPECIES: zinc ribbon domain-containing protein [Clostridium]MDF2504758.1 hypothetical protein [Clostridium sp.]
MSYCKNCGNELKEGENFCSECGTPIGKVNTNKKAITETQTVNLFSKVISEIWETFISMIKTPLTTITKVDKIMSKETAAVFTILMALILGLLEIWNTKVLIDNAATSFGDRMLEQYFNMNQFLGNLYGRIFIITAIIFIISMGVMFIIDYLVGRIILGGQDNPEALWKVVIASNVPNLFGFFLFIVLSYISPIIGLIPLLIGSILSQLSLFRGLTKEFQLSENKSACTLIAGYFGLILIVFLLLKLILSSIVG